MISTPPPPPVIAPVSAPAAISSFAGVQVWNEGDKLIVRHDGQITSIADAEDGDVGPGPDGAPRLAFLRGDHVVVSQLDGTDAHAVPGTRSAEMPTIYGNRVAYEYNDRPVVIDLRDTQHRHNLRYLGTTITDLELHGSTLGVTDTFVGDDFSYDTVYLESVTNLDAWPRMVGTVTGGEAGRSLLGPSFAQGRFYFYEACLIDELSCQGVFRYDPKTHKTETAASHKGLMGFAIDDDGEHAFEIPGTYESAENGDPTEVRYSNALTFKPRKYRLGAAAH